MTKGLRSRLLNKYKNFQKRRKHQRDRLRRLLGRNASAYAGDNPDLQGIVDRRGYLKPRDLAEANKGMFLQQLYKEEFERAEKAVNQGF